MSPEAFDSWQQVGERIRLAREAMGLTQAELARKIGVARHAVTKIEQGKRHLSALELASVAQATGLSLAWFVTNEPAVVVSRRDHGDGDALPTDLRVGKLKRELEQLLELKLLRPSVRGLQLPFPEDFEGAAEAALTVREAVGRSDGRIDVADAAELLGLYVYVLPLPSNAISGASAVVDDQIGVALVKSSDTPARQRFTIAHEIGHHVFQDAYDPASFGGDAERIINSFAADLLMPRSEVRASWAKSGSDSSGIRMTAITMAASYEVSWSALCPHLHNIGLINHEEWRQLEDWSPTGAEYESLGFAHVGSPAVEELRIPAAIRTAVLAGYRRYLLGEGRVRELLYGTLATSELPERNEIRTGALKAQLALV